MTAFDKLSEEGRMQKIAQHLAEPGLHPVPAPWVQWLLDRFTPKALPQKNLYAVTNSQQGLFYVVATDQTTAARMAQAQWKTWRYLGEGAALKVELVAEGAQYGAVKNTWLLVQD